MVALAGSGWKLAPSLARLVSDVDVRHPNRNRASDGSIGDAAHAARSSFHNPSDGWVDALDLTHQAGVFDAHGFADALVARKPAWMDHVISNRRIASAARGWQWRAYDGTNPHDKHAHFAVLRNEAGRTSTAPWFPQEDDMAQIDDVLALLKDLHAELPTIRRLRQVIGTDKEPKDLPAGAGGSVDAVKQALREGTG